MSTVLITGAASGIGKAAAVAFAAAGWRCVLLDLDGDRLGQVVRDLPASAENGAHRIVVADLTRPAALSSLADTVVPIDALLNNAGISDQSGCRLTEMSEAQFARVPALNLETPYRLLEALLPRLTPGARVVNVASGAALRAIPFRGGYSASKAGLVRLSDAMAHTWPELRFAVLFPGFVQTELIDGLIAAGRVDPVRAVSRIPLGRMGQPEELAQALLFLAGPESDLLRDRHLRLDGGSSVYGGTMAFPPTDLSVMPLDTPLALTLRGWPGMVPSAFERSLAGTAGGYAARIDASPLAAPPGLRMQAVLTAARDFAATHPDTASLTLLLPAEVPGDDCLAQADLTAARMLVSTLACEMGGRALRVNALELARTTAPEQLGEILAFVAGARAQYLNGQTLHV